MTQIAIIMEEDEFAGFIADAIDQVDETLPTTDQASQSYADIRDIFDAAIEDPAVVQFVYHKEDDEVPQIRTITPSEVRSNGVNESVVGHDHDRDFARRFRLDRVTAAVPLLDGQPYLG